MDIREEVKKLSNQYACALFEKGDTISEKNFARGMAVESVTSRLESPFEQIRELVDQRGVLLVDSPEEGKIGAFIMGGFANMNHVIFVVLVDGKEVQLGAYAKEGLIHQHSVQKLIDEFLTTI